MQVSAVSGGYDYGLAIGMSSLRGLQGTQGKQGPPPASLAGKLLSDIDTDANGSISESEFETFLNAKSTGTSSDTAAQAASLFKKVDANGDGQISASEWSAFQNKIKQHHHHHQKSSDTQDSQQVDQGLRNMVNQIYKGADANADGQLSQSELTDWLQKSFGGSQVNAAF